MKEQLQARLQQLTIELSDSFDVVKRHLQIEGHDAILLFLSSLSDSQLISNLVEGLTITATNHVELTFYPGSVEKVKDPKKAVINMLSGQCLVCLLYTSRCV